MNTDELRHLRNAFGSYMTGVTVVTALDSQQQPRGFTANSFTSVSLDPALVSICIDKSADSFDVFTACEHFGITVLSEEQADISSLFAAKRADKFSQVNWHYGKLPVPLIAGGCAYFECDMFAQVEAGDHVILIGKVKNYDYNDLSGLGYAKGGYFRLGLEQSAMQAAQNNPHVEVGVIIEHDGQVVLLPAQQNSDEYELPISGQRGKPGSLNKLLLRLQQLHIDLHITSLYAVFENDDTEHQTILYRAEARELTPAQLFYAFANIPWDKMADGALKKILKRYIEESQSQRFGVYFENANSGNF